MGQVFLRKSLLDSNHSVNYCISGDVRKAGATRDVNLYMLLRVLEFVADYITVHSLQQFNTHTDVSR
jgi:hypothetical protein